MEHVSESWRLHHKPEVFVLLFATNAYVIDWKLY